MCLSASIYSEAVRPYILKEAWEKKRQQQKDNHGVHQGQLSVCFLSLELEIALSVSSDLCFIFNNILVKTVHQTEGKDYKLHFFNFSILP